MATRRIDEVIAKLKSAIDRHQRTIDEWKDRYGSNTLSALQWSEDTFRAAARQGVCYQLLNTATSIAGKEPEILAAFAMNYHCEDDPHAVFWAYIRAEIGDKLRFSRSTSRTHNLVQEYTTEAWTDIVFGPAFTDW